MRVLVIDDNRAIHEDFKKVLQPRRSQACKELDALEAELFGAPAPSAAPTGPDVDVSCAGSGRAGLDLLTKALEGGEPFAMAFVDMRMPPGWDGVRTIQELWKVDPRLQVVICTAFSDYSWDDLHSEFGKHDNLLILKKPFDSVEVLQLAMALTAKWEAERAAEARIEHLDALVAERTRHLEEEMARRTQMESELRLASRLRAVGQLAAGVAHEINTPLQFISDNAHYLAEVLAHLDDEDELLEEPKTAATELVEGVDRVAEVVVALKSFTEVSTDVSRADLVETLTNAMELLRGQVERHASLELELQGLPHVRCAPADLQQAVVQLVDNARLAVADSGRRGTIRVSGRTTEEGVEIRIEDDGIGIEDGDYERVFEPYVTSRDVGDGHGYGLTLARSAIQRQGGHIWLEPRPDGGTAGCIRLHAA